MKMTLQDLLAPITPERFFAEPFDPAAPLWRVLCVDGVGHGGAILTAASPLLRVEEVPVDLLDIALDSRHDSADLAPIPAPEPEPTVEATPEPTETATP